MSVDDNSATDQHVADVADSSITKSVGHDGACVTCTPEGLDYRCQPFTVTVRKNRTRWEVIVRREQDVLGVESLNLADAKGRRNLLGSLRGVTPGEAEALGAALVRLAAKVATDWKNCQDKLAGETHAAEEKQLVDTAERAQAAKEKRLADIEGVAAVVLADPRLLCRIGRAVAARGVVGEGANALIVVLAVISQITDDPISVVVKGDSSGGKSFLVVRVLKLFPDDWHIDFTSMSEKALIYDPREYKHKTVVVFEVHGQGGEFSSYIIRTLISEGCIRHQTVEQDAGRLVGRELTPFR
jgi:hypothetical protein